PRARFRYCPRPRCGCRSPPAAPSPERVVARLGARPRPRCRPGEKRRSTAPAEPDRVRSAPRRIARRRAPPRGMRRSGCSSSSRLPLLRVPGSAGLRPGFLPNAPELLELREAPVEPVSVALADALHAVGLRPVDAIGVLPQRPGLEGRRNVERPGPAVLGDPEKAVRQNR